MLKAVDKLPKGTEICVVEGGNHRGFASYSYQPLDWEVSKYVAKSRNSEHCTSIVSTRLFTVRLLVC